MRRPAPALAAAIAGLAVPAAAGAMDHDGGKPAVSIQFASFTPPRTDVLAGDTATWRNDSARIHTVTATDGSWSSEHVLSGSTFSHRFTAPGVYAYYCQLHPSMRGEIDVQRLLLDAPTEALAAGRPYVLAGRAALPAGQTVSIEADARPVAHAVVGADGSFKATIVPHTSASYRAVSGADSSPAVQVLVLDRKLTATAVRHGRRTVVGVRVTPSSPGATVVLQLRLRDRFGWWPVRRARVGAQSTARFLLRPRHRVRARVVLTLRDGATVLAKSATLRLRR